MKKKSFKANKKVKKEMSEFKKFISKGSIIDMAIGVIIGGAFGKIVTSLVNDIIMPLIGIILGGLDFSELQLKIGDASIRYGSFIQSVVDFLIIAICIFIMIQVLKDIKAKADLKLGKKKEEVIDKKSDEVLLLMEIRDLLAKDK